MDSQIIKNKSIIKIDNDEIVDLTTKSIDWNEDDVAILDSFYISEDMEMRADLVSYLSYGSTDYYDIILKFNNISNPFSLMQGEYIFVPELSYIANQLTNPNKSKNKKDIINQYIDNSKKISPDLKRLEYIAKIKNLTLNVPTNRISKYNLPPNLAEPGSSEASIISGTVSLGESN